MSVYFISSFPKANNDSGVVMRAATTGNVLNNVARPLNPEDMPFGSQVVFGVNTQSALPIGNFAFNNKRPIVKGSTTSINGNSFSSSALAVSSTGNANTGLTSSIHPVQYIRTRLVSTAMRENRFNEVSGKFEPGYPDVQLDNLLLDVAASPTRNNPGRIHFAHGRRLISTSYRPKTG